jgi:hypothetical protein
MINKLNVLVSSFVIILTLATSQFTCGSHRQEDPYQPFNTLPHEVTQIIVTDAAFQQALNYNFPGNLAIVNKRWNKTIEGLKQEVKNPVWKLLQGVADDKDEATYQTFLNGKLVYRPIPGSDAGTIEFKISDFLHPFKGTFNISLCGDTAKYLTITTDPAVFFQINQKNPTCHILIAPHFLIKKYITSSTKSFMPIMNGWDATKAPVGIFWRWCGYDDLSWYDHGSSSSSAVISSKDLFENWKESTWCWPELLLGSLEEWLRAFSCLFLTPNKD